MAFRPEPQRIISLGGDIMQTVRSIGDEILLQRPTASTGGKVLGTMNARSMPKAVSMPKPAKPVKRDSQRNADIALTNAGSKVRRHRRLSLPSLRCLLEISADGSLMQLQLLLR